VLNLNNKFNLGIMFRQLEQIRTGVLLLHSRATGASLANSILLADGVRFTRKFNAFNRQQLHN
jgi:hypothetical protein